MNIGDIISGPFFPEVIEIKRIEAFGEEYYLLEGIGRQTNRYHEQLLAKNDLDQITILSTSTETKMAFTGQDIQQRLIHLTLEIEDKYSKTRALGNQQVIPLPHQIEAVYSRMLQTSNVRFLLADDPGAGKTIMAGMLIKELKARESIKRILVLVPPLVLRQWQEEMDQKFQEDFKIINRAVLNEYGSKNPFIENDFCLASIYWSTRDEIKELILEAQFDLVIVDEAHKMAAYSYGKIKKKTSKTRLYRLGEKLLAKTEHCLLLTATPHKGDAENYRLLMKLIEPDLFNHVSASESLRDKSNPFVIRRLKESMVNFDSTPIFPRRTTKTIQYELTEPELDLYDAVTEYVKTHFNRAMSSGNNSTAFAMMLLQRRLSSSIEAIHRSLYRRYKKLLAILDNSETERKKFSQQLEKLYNNGLEEEITDTQDMLEKKLELAVDIIDIDALQEEIAELKKLLIKTTSLRKFGSERKYLELEEMLFGVDGLIYTGEKILIFTESVDTLKHLEVRLSDRVSKIAKIMGSLSMDERRKQVELFRETAQVMLATDAGGESINLQFCNQMINYDIPWNPNKLEQRMGRIHRIGQKNEVFIFNLVAQNTREGYVMARLLAKLEMMKEDLGNDLVYNFMGELLEDDINLSDLMKDAILSRENLDDVVAKMDKSLSEEHRLLLQTMERMQFDAEAIDIQAMKKSQYDVEINKIPNRVYVELIDYALKESKVKVFDSHEGKVKRIDRFPKLIRDQFSKMTKLDDSYRFTGFIEHSNSDVQYVTKTHPIYHLSKILLARTSDQFAFKRYLFTYDVPVHLEVDMYRVVLKDGIGKELINKLIFIAKRADHSLIELNPYWLSMGHFSEGITELPLTEQAASQSHMLKLTITEKSHIEQKRTNHLNRMHDYLVDTFNMQYNEVYEKLIQYQTENEDNKNSALINQMNAQLIDIEEQKKKRLDTINKQRTITLQPPKKIAQFELIPNGGSYRVMASDYYEMVAASEKTNGRKLVKMYDNLGLVDFYSERFNGEERFIVLTNKPDFMLSEAHIEDLNSIIDKTYVYLINGDEFVEMKLTTSLFKGLIVNLPQ
ncbi:helicase-related protein [Psychrobacillus sp. MER TA 171]|uniref:helicase-related protein n=1 Tax=Psychrobacillus sp. MER TA 171 TaxID=2939577 RepID=UPI00203C2683|nr:helicase-related protein [Psychrobacillus sp. MER TA 171]MCM3358658.1 SNF2-related protein [Psychrobacillus sp. MER TA 171]